MNPIHVGLIVFACTFLGALFGMWLRVFLPAHHLDDGSRDTVKVGIGLIATMTALVLGIVTASAKGSFDASATAVEQTAIDLLTLDRLLARYGPETRELRGAVQQAVIHRIDTIWVSGSPSTGIDPIRSGAALEVETLADAIGNLMPRDDSQLALQSRAQNVAETLLQTRWLVFTGAGASTPLPFLVVLVFWLGITFVSFGLFAPRNGTVLAVLFVCALSVGSAVFLILEMDGPFDGMLRVSAEPLLHTVDLLNR